MVRAKSDAARLVFLLVIPAQCIQAACATFLIEPHAVEQDAGLLQSKIMDVPNLKGKNYVGKIELPFKFFRY